MGRRVDALKAKAKSVKKGDVVKAVGATILVVGATLVAVAIKSKKRTTRTGSSDLPEIAAVEDAEVQ
jgi:hypothetical protein